MKIAALHARISGAKQRLNENIASQITAVEEYARQRDYRISPRHIYEDDGHGALRANDRRK